MRTQQNIDNIKTEIILILDRSGSMQSIKYEMEETLASMIEDQKNHSGECLVTLLQFDNTEEYVYRNKDIYELPPIKIIPRGGTALYDAMGKAIIDTETKISEYSTREKPDKIIVITITDGEENASRKYSKEVVAKLTSEKEETGWRFYYLGANQDAFKVAKTVGVKATNSIKYETTRGSMRAMARAVSMDVARSRKDISRPLDSQGKEMTLQAMYQQELTCENIATNTIGTIVKPKK